MTILRPTGYMVVLDETTDEWRGYLVEDGQYREEVSMPHSARLDYATALRRVTRKRVREGGFAGFGRRRVMRRL